MNPSHSPKGNPSPRKEPARRIEPSSPAGKALPLRLRYYSTLKPQRVFPLTVEVPEGAASILANAGTLTIKPSIPGALIEPAEQDLDASKPANSVTFQVTPIAKGKLPGAGVKVVQQGRLLAQTPLAMHSKTQFATWVWLLLMVVAPIWLTHVTKHPLMGSVPRLVKPREKSEALAANAGQKPQEPEKKKEDGDKSKEKDKDKAGKDKPPQEDQTASRREGRAADQAQGGQGRGRGAGPNTPGPRRPPGEGGGRPVQASEDAPRYEEYGVTSGGYLEYLVKKRVHNTVTGTSMPRIPYLVDSDPSDVVDNKPSDALSWIAWVIGKAYDMMIAFSDEIGTVTFALLLFIATASWVTHKCRMRSQKATIQLGVEGRSTFPPRGNAREDAIPLAEPLQ